MSEKTYTGRVEHITALTPTILSIQCQVTPAMTFVAGQYVMVGFPPKEGTERPTGKPTDFPRWPFALASEPSQPVIEFCIRQQTNHPLQRLLADLKPDSLLDIQGPFGNFTYHNPEHQRVVFVATGTGIAPFRSMIRSKSFQANRPDTTILLGARSEAEIPYWEEWQQSCYKVIPILSQADADWQGERGWVTDYLQQADSLIDTNTVYYLCGHLDMLHKATELLRARGVPARSIHPSQ